MFQSLFLAVVKVLCFILLFLFFSCRTLLDFLRPLLQLSASPIYSVRVKASKALVAMTPSSQYADVLIRLTSQLPSPLESCSHNQLHGQLLQIRAILDRALCTDRWDFMMLIVHSFIRNVHVLLCFFPVGFQVTSMRC